MENPSDPKRSLYLMASLLFLVLSVTFIVKLFQPPWFKNIKMETTEQPYARTFVVVAEGKVSAKPDLARINLSVISQGKTVKEVTTDSNQKMTAVIDSMKKIGIEDKDLNTTAYDLYPEYRYPDYRSPVLTGYRLTQELAVKVRDLEKVDEVLDAATKAGANQVGQLSFEVDDLSKVKREAREKAFKAARDKAEEMSDAAGVNLGRVVTFSESTDNYYYGEKYQYNFALQSDTAVGSDASVQPGSKEFTISVNVTYEIE